ncbi:MAG: rhodanese-like domain-containing protein [bacterium]|nr:rhodanese-like domain-containing protein [bacterium]
MRTRIPLLLLASAWLFACAEAESPITSIAPEALLSAPPAGALILDVRRPDEYATSHVPGAINVPHDQVEARIAELGEDRARTIVVYCEKGRRAGLAGDVLLAAGFSDVRHLEGDMSGWREAGRPTAQP